MVFKEQNFITVMGLLHSILYKNTYILRMQRVQHGTVKTLLRAKPVRRIGREGMQPVANRYTGNGAEVRSLHSPLFTDR